MSTKSNGYFSRIKQELSDVERQLAKARAELPEAEKHYVTVRDSYLEQVREIRENNRNYSLSMKQSEEARMDSRPVADANARYLMLQDLVRTLTGRAAELRVIAEASDRLEKLKNELTNARLQHGRTRDERDEAMAAAGRISQAIEKSEQELKRITQTAGESADVKKGVLSVDPRITRLKDEISFGNEALEQAKTRVATLEQAEADAQYRINDLTRRIPECLSRVAMIRVLDSIDMDAAALAAAATHNPRQFVITISDEHYQAAQKRIVDETNGITG